MNEKGEGEGEGEGKGHVQNYHEGGEIPKNDIFKYHF